MTENSGFSTGHTFAKEIPGRKGILKSLTVL
jgi:hypothetical protein